MYKFNLFAFVQNARGTIMGFLAPGKCREWRKKIDGHGSRTGDKGTGIASCFQVCNALQLRNALRMIRAMTAPAERMKMMRQTPARARPARVAHRRCRSAPPAHGNGDGWQSKICRPRFRIVKTKRLDVDRVRFSEFDADATR